MTQLNQQRMRFIENLHETFVMRTGFGAFAFITAVDANNLFEQFMDSGESADSFIDRYVRSI